MEITISIHTNTILIIIGFIYISSYLLLEAIEFATFDEYKSEHISYGWDIGWAFKRGLWKLGFGLILELPTRAKDEYLKWLKYKK